MPLSWCLLPQDVQQALECICSHIDAFWHILLTRQHMGLALINCDSKIPGSGESYWVHPGAVDSIRHCKCHSLEQVLQHQIVAAVESMVWLLVKHSGI